jgi:TusA-related sulfurtransferase
MNLQEIEMEVRSDILIDVSSAPVTLKLPTLRKEMERMRSGEVLKVKTMSMRDGGVIRELALQTRCDVLCSKMVGRLAECLIRKP